MLLEGADASLAPMALVALTVKVTGAPLARPVTMMDVQGARQEAVTLPGVAVAA